MTFFFPYIREELSTGTDKIIYQLPIFYFIKNTFYIGHFKVYYRYFPLSRNNSLIDRLCFINYNNSNNFYFDFIITKKGG